MVVGAEVAATARAASRSRRALGATANVGSRSPRSPACFAAIAATNAGPARRTGTRHPGDVAHHVRRIESESTSR